MTGTNPVVHTADELVAKNNMLMLTKQLTTIYCGYPTDHSSRPMSCQPMYRMHGFIGRNGNLRAQTNAYIAGGSKPVGWDIFDRGLCLPSDNKMTEEQQDRIIQVIRACFE